MGGRQRDLQPHWTHDFANHFSDNHSSKVSLAGALSIVLQRSSLFYPAVGRRCACTDRLSALHTRSVVSSHRPAQGQEESQQSQDSVDLVLENDNTSLRTSRVPSAFEPRPFLTEFCLFFRQSLACSKSSLSSVRLVGGLPNITCHDSATPVATLQQPRSDSWAHQH